MSAVTAAADKDAATSAEDFMLEDFRHTGTNCNNFVFMRQILAMQ